MKIGEYYKNGLGVFRVVYVQDKENVSLKCVQPFLFNDKGAIFPRILDTGKTYHLSTKYSPWIRESNKISKIEGVLYDNTLKSSVRKNSRRG